MKTTILLSFALLSASAFAQSGAVDEVKAAAKKLSEAANYSWTTTTKVPEESRFRPGPVEGKAAKDGFAMVTTTMGERTSETIFKGGKSVVKTDDGWQTPEERRNARGDGGGGNRPEGGRPEGARPEGARREGGGGGGGNAGGNRGAGGPGGGWAGGRGAFIFRTPATQAEGLAGQVKELTKDGDAFTGELTEAALKEMLTMGGRRRDGSEAPTPTGAKGSVKFWIKDGVLAKYETSVAGTISFNGNEMKLDRTATTEIKDVGTTTVNIPEEAKKKIESAPAAPAAPTPPAAPAPAAPAAPAAKE